MLAALYVARVPEVQACGNFESKSVSLDMARLAASLAEELRARFLAMLCQRPEARRGVCRARLRHSIRPAALISKATKKGLVARDWSAYRVGVTTAAVGGRMSQPVEPESPNGQEWESQCLDAMLTRSRDLDRNEAKLLIHAAWSIERFRTLTPKLAAEQLLQNPGVRPGTR
jgi:hypothetical protein